MELKHLVHYFTVSATLYQAEVVLPVIHLPTQILIKTLILSDY